MQKYYHITLIYWLLLISQCSFAQGAYSPWTFEECNQRPDQWHKCLTLTPRYLGPNALPVPAFKKGNIPQKTQILIASQNHISKQDRTFNSFVKVQIPIHKRVLIEMYGVPFEHYRTNLDIQDERGIMPWNYTQRGTASGDVYFATIIQLIDNQKRNIQLATSINLRTASGNRLENARFTDTPGYFFDISFGKKYLLAHPFFKSIHFYTTVGFYVWQTFSDRFPQDDAFLYGAGVEFIAKRWHWDNAWGGYRGYLQGDKPTVYRSQLSYHVNNIALGVGYQLGLKDYIFQTCEFSFTYKLSNFFKEK